jgi:GAF domain-containing protein
VPCASGDDLAAVLALEGEALTGRDVLPYFAEAIDLAVAQFLQWQVVQDKVERLAFAEHLSRAALSGALPAEILRDGLQTALEATGAERIIALGLDDTGNLAMRLGLETGGIELPPATPISRSICQWVVSTREAVRLLDAQGLEGWQKQQSILALGLRTIVAVPLKRGDEVRGVLYMDSANLMTTFGPREQALLEAAAEVLAPLVVPA